jgi:hypothetical protein
MSQSDYIQYKKISNQLLEVSKLDPILDSRDYTNFKQYYLESNVSNTKITNNNLPLTGYTNVFGMSKKITHCPIHNFTMCNNTNSRDNRQNLINILNTNHRTESYYLRTDKYPVNSQRIKQITSIN